MTDSGCEDTVPTMGSVCKLPEESDASMRARLFTSLSQSFPHSQLYKALHGGEDINLNGGDNSEDDDDSLYGDHLSNSCFASLRMDRRDSDDFDDDLRSLEWLQNEDLLKNIGGEKLDKEDDDNEEQKENEDIKPDIDLLQPPPGQQPPHLPYHPQKHVNSKPPYSFSCLIFMAVEASPQKRLPVKDIYNWILTQFPYFQNAPTGWKNSVRHNLSLNKCFKKVEKDKGQSIGKGSLWCIDPAYRPNLLQALRKTPYHPYHQLQMTSTQPQNYVQYQSLPGGGRTVLPLTQRPVPNTVSPHLFPFLSRRLAQTSFDVDNEIKDVAQTLVALKGSYKKESTDSSSGEDIGPTWRRHKRSYSYNNPHGRPSSPVVVTGHPYDDHAYSSTRILDDDVPSPSSSSSIDEEYDFGDADEEGESDYQSDMEWDSDDKDEVDGDLPSNKKLRIDLRGAEGSPSTSAKGMTAAASATATINESEDDEQKKIHEGASALLNLAGLLLNNRSTSSSPDGKRNSHCFVAEPKKEKKRRSKKARDEVKKMADNHKEESEGQRRRSVSKRKNAGSNGKYDTEEYSLIKPGKTAKSRTPTPGTSKGGKAKSTHTRSPAEKVSSTGLKTKASVKGSVTNAKSVRKSGGRKKLQLSKNFSAANKPPDPNKSKASRKPQSSGKSAAKKVVSKKEPSKNGSVLKKNKTGGNKVVSLSEDSSLQDSNKTPSTLENSNNSEGKGALSRNDKLAASERPMINIVDGKDSKEAVKVRFQPQGRLAPLVNGEILSPAGDAPVSLAESSVGDNKTLEVRLPSHRASSPAILSSKRGHGDVKEAAVNHKTSPPGIKSSSSSHLPPSHLASSSAILSSKRSYGDATEAVDKAVGNHRTSPPSIKSSSSSHLPSGTAALYKSPHFTRFSKKKAAL